MGAVEKISAEMQKDPANVYMEIIGHYIIDRCIDAEAEAKVVADGKTLAGAMAAVTGAAKKKKSGNVAVLLPAEVFGMVDKYFGLKTDAAAQMRAMATVGGAAAPPTAPETPKLSGAMALDFNEMF